MDILTGYICDYICVDAHKVFPSYHSQLVSSYYSLSAVGVYLEQIQIHHSKTDTTILIFGLQSFMELFSVLRDFFEGFNLFPHYVYEMCRNNNL